MHVILATMGTDRRTGWRSRRTVSSRWRHAFEHAFEAFEAVEAVEAVEAAKAVVGIVIAALVLLPETWAACVPPGRIVSRAA